jgi:hypothetical protein
MTHVLDSYMMAKTLTGTDTKFNHIFDAVMAAPKFSDDLNKLYNEAFHDTVRDTNTALVAAQNVRDLLMGDDIEPTTQMVEAMASYIVTYPTEGRPGLSAQMKSELSQNSVALKAYIRDNYKDVARHIYERLATYANDIEADREKQFNSKDFVINQTATSSVSDYKVGDHNKAPYKPVYLDVPSKGIDQAKQLEKMVAYIKSYNALSMKKSSRVKEASTNSATVLDTIEKVGTGSSGELTEQQGTVIGAKGSKYTIKAGDKDTADDAKTTYSVVGVNFAVLAETFVETLSSTKMDVTEDLRTHYYTKEEGETKTRLHKLLDEVARIHNKSILALTSADIYNFMSNSSFFSDKDKLSALNTTEYGSLYTDQVTAMLLSAVANHNNSTLTKHVIYGAVSLSKSKNNTVQSSDRLTPTRKANMTTIRVVENGIPENAIALTVFFPNILTA